MIISCQCGAKLKISDEKLTGVAVKVKCPKCGTLHAASRPAAASAELPAAGAVRDPAVRTTPAMPWFAAAAPPAGRMPLVLIAHDSKAVADMIGGVLEGSGMATDRAADGLEALKKAGSLRPQAMIVDVGLSGIYGFELCERLKGDPDTSSIKIILLSSVYGLTSYKRAPVTLYGADDYIEKHHIPDELVPKLRALLSEKEPDAVRTAEQPADRGPFLPEAAPAPSSGPATPLISKKGMIVRSAREKEQAAREQAAREGDRSADILGDLGTDRPPPQGRPAGPEVLPGTDVRNIPAPRPVAPRTSVAPDRDRTAPQTLPDASSFADEVLSPQSESAEPTGLQERPIEKMPAPRPLARTAGEPDRDRTAPQILPDASSFADEVLSPPLETAEAAAFPGISAGEKPAPRPAASHPPPAPAAATPASPEQHAEHKGPAAEAAIEVAAPGDEAFFERDEYAAPAAAPTAAAVDPDAIEKARRFARLIVSDIALYNEEAVAEGIGKGTFYEILQDDITEGRAVYENRVPEAIRTTGDYLQEAFDNFIAAKKKLR